MLSCFRKYKSLALVMTLVVTNVFSTVTYCYAEDNKVQENKYVIPINFDFDRTNTYEKYLDKYKSTPSPSSEVIVKAADYAATDDKNIKISDSYDGKNKVLAWTSNTNWVEWNVNVPEAGMYNINIGYNPGTAAKNDIGMKIEINNQLPFNEAANSVLTRVWKDSTAIQQDDRGNDLKPKMEMVSRWLNYDLIDGDGSYTEPFKFYLNKGENKIKLTSNQETFYMDAIKIYQKPVDKSYKDISAQYQSKGYKNANSMLQKIQGENAYQKSSVTLYDTYDRSDPAIEPSDVSKTRINTIGGANWKSSGQWISWKIEVPENGLYKLGVKYKQGYNTGLFANRKLLIDGKVPFSEVNDIKLPYNTEWNVMTLGEKDPYLFYLEKGTHEVSMEVTLGAYTDMIRSLNNCVFSLNDMYRRIIMISGEAPDQYTDYYFEKQIPNLQKTFTDVAVEVKKQSAKLKEINGKVGSETAMLDNLASQLESMSKNPDTISTRLTKYKDNISTLSAWILKVKEQPIDIDYLVVASPDSKMPAAKASILQAAKFSTQRFFTSFTEDYNIISNKAEKDKPTVKVWVNLGRDQVGIIKDMVNDLFTPKTGINVQLELVQGSVIEATLAGKGPDVALMVGNADPINFALRGALVDLSTFKDFKEVSQRFSPSAMVPFQFQGKCYAIPDTQDFNMMFYRKDVLSQLGLGVPQTWDEFYKMIPIIQQNKMDIGIPETLYNTLIFQRGGRYYKDDLKATAFDEKVNVDAFKEITNLFIRYNFNLKFDGYTRLRTGEMPIMIQPYTLYSKLSASAPEIKGLWDMAPIPGTVDKDGKINRAEEGTPNACIMFQNAKYKDASWEFLKWFSSAEVQARYGTELESILGPAGRYATANREAFKQLPWNRKEIENLSNQWDYVQGIPQTPGSYYTTRGLTNAFNTTVNGKGSSVENLTKWNKDINDEIARKFKEFGIK